MKAITYYGTLALLLILAAWVHVQNKPQPHPGINVTNAIVTTWFSTNLWTGPTNSFNIITITNGTSHPIQIEIPQPPQPVLPFKYKHRLQLQPGETVL